MYTAACSAYELVHQRHMEADFRTSKRLHNWLAVCPKYTDASAGSTDTFNICTKHQCAANISNAITNLITATR